MDIRQVMAQLKVDMSKTGRGAFRPDEVVGLVQSAIDAVVKEDQRRETEAHPPYTTECLDEANGCTCRRKGQASCCMHGSEKP